MTSLYSLRSLRTDSCPIPEQAESPKIPREENIKDTKRFIAAPSRQIQIGWHNYRYVNASKKYFCASERRDTVLAVLAEI
jgi:hypothetical protein